MIIDINLNSGLPITKMLHIFISVTFLVIAIWIFIRSFNGIYSKNSYTRLDKLLAFGFIISLYLQLIFGIVLFSKLGSNMEYHYLSADSSMKIVSKRLWPVEHIVLMLFALIIANLGLIISINTNLDSKKHKIILIYYSISIFLIIFSLCVIYLF